MPIPYCLAGETMTPTAPLPPTRPRLRLDFYDSAILLSRYEETAVSSYPVSALDVAAACTKLTAATGFLPPDTLFWRQNGSVTALGIYVPARRWTVQTPEATRHIPLPPLVFAGEGRNYAIFAVKQRPQDGQTRLYRAPCPNVGDNGRICRGNVPFPVCSGQTIGQALALFMEGSRFNDHQAAHKCRAFPQDVRQLWAQLEDKRRFPLGQLVASRCRLSALL
jgi:PRTRC genetic system protein B